MAGVTLLELMAVVVIIGILGIIALPSYRQYTMRAQRTEAKTALLQLATNQERFYLQNHRYGGTADLEALGFTSAQDRERHLCDHRASVADIDDLHGHRPPPGSGAAIDQTLDTDCTSFSINAQACKSATPDPNQRCW